MTFQIQFLSEHRKAEHPPDPAFPDGVEIDCTDGKPGWTCSTELPYPAPCCGIWMVLCTECGFKVGLTAAGRIDDPRRVKMHCKKPRQLG